MNKALFWFLDAAVRYWFPLNWLTAPNLEEIINRPGHHLPRTEVLTTLVHLANTQLIGFSYYDPNTDTDIVVTLTKADMDAVLDLSDRAAWASKQRLSYHLTAAGGTLWEALACPDWNKFYEDMHMPDHRVQVTTATCTFGQQLVPYLQANWEPASRICADTITCATITPWEATYWKTLSQGCVITYTYELTDVSEGIYQPVPYIRAWLEDVWHWYQPFDGQNGLTTPWS